MGNFGKISLSVVFKKAEEYFSELLYTQSDFPYERHFLAPRGQEGGNRMGEESKFPISNKMIPRNSNCLKIQNFARGIWFWNLFLSSDIFWLVLGHPRGQGGGGRGQKGQKLSIPLKMIPRSWRFIQRYNFSSQILYFHSFRANCKFLLFLWHPRGQKGSKIVHFSESNAQKLQICTEKKFFTRHLILQLI